MFKSSRRVSLIPVALAAVASYTAITHASHSWNGYHWARTSNPFTLKLGNNLTTAD